MLELDLDFCRAQFPLLKDKDAEGYFDNAGGSYVPRQVIDAMSRFMETSQTQPDWPFAASRRAHDRIERAQKGVADLFNIDPEELVIGPSTTLNAYILSHALRAGMTPGDAIVVTNQDHEANSGCWRRMSETGIEVREWKINPVTGDLDPEDLKPLLADGKVTLVAFPHVSNIVGSVNDVGTIVEHCHAAGALTVVDGVAAVAHSLPDLKALDTDFYMFSFYKLYGPHQALLYGKKERIDSIKNQNHFFHEGKGAAMLNPGGTNYESAGSIGGILSYFDAVYDHHFKASPVGSSPGGANSPGTRALAVYELFQRQENRLMARFLDWLDTRTGSGSNMRLIGRREADPAKRAATFSLAFKDRNPMDIAEALAQKGQGVGAGHFYGYRCVEALGIPPETGVLRISMVHYTTLEEVERLIEALEEVLG